MNTADEFLEFKEHLSNLYSVPIDAWSIESIPSDASKRKYYRISRNCDQDCISSFIIMDARLDNNSDIAFAKTAIILQKQDIRVPSILMQSKRPGFLLVEDFGSLSMNQYLQTNQHNVLKSYRLMIDLLLDLEKTSMKTQLDLPSYNKERFLNEVQVFLDWYIATEYLADNKAAQAVATADFLELFSTYYDQLSTLPEVLSLRDFMVDNIMCLTTDPTLTIGLIDFQDAINALPFYDLASLLHDARIYVSQQLENECLAYYYQATSFKQMLSYDQFIRYFHMTAVQKNLRIVGVFHRLKYRDAKPRYMQFIPRMFEYIERNLKHLPEFQDLAQKHNLPFIA